MKLNFTLQLLVYADVSLSGNTIHTVKKNPESVLVNSNDTALEETGSAENTKYVFTPREQKAGKNIKMDGNCLKVWQSLHIWE